MKPQQAKKNWVVDKGQYEHSLFWKLLYFGNLKLSIRKLKVGGVHAPPKLRENNLISTKWWRKHALISCKIPHHIAQEWGGGKPFVHSFTMKKPTSKCSGRGSSWKCSPQSSSKLLQYYKKSPCTSVTLTQMDIVQFMMC